MTATNPIQLDMFRVTPKRIPHNQYPHCTQSFNNPTWYIQYTDGYPVIQGSFPTLEAAQDALDIFLRAHPEHVRGETVWHQPHEVKP